MSAVTEQKRFKKIGLLIGNDGYDQKSNRLKTSIENVQDFGTFLKKANFSVTIHENCKDRKMKEAIRIFLKQINKYDVALFYYSGHACHVNEKNHLIPVNDEKIEKYDDIPEHSSNFHDIIEHVKELKPKGSVIFILDCPHRYVPEKIPTTISTTTGPGLINMKMPRRTIVQFACAAKETIENETGIDKQQFFHKKLMEFIVEPNINIFEVLTRTNDAVRKASQDRQLPLLIREENDYPEIIIYETPPLELADIPYGAVWTSNGVTVAGGFGAGPTTTRLNIPRGLCVTKQLETVISDRNNNRIIKFSPNNVFGNVQFGYLNGRYLPDRLCWPSDVMCDPANNEYTVSDTHNREVVIIESRYVKNEVTIVNNLHCRGIAHDGKGNTFVCDAERHEVRCFGSKFGKQGLVVAGGNGQGDRLHQLSYPSYVAIGPNNSVYVSDSWNNRVVRWDVGAHQGLVVAGGQGPGKNLNQLHCPTGLAVDQSGTIYVADYWNHRVMRWYVDAKQGEILIGNRFLAGNEPDHLNLPEGLAFDQYGNLYVADSNNHRVQRFHMKKPEQSVYSDN